MASDTLYDLRDVLVEAYQDLPRAREVAERAGIVAGTLPSASLPMRDWWWEAIQTLQRQGKLLALVDAAIADPTVAALKPRFEALCESVSQMRSQASSRAPGAAPSGGAADALSVSSPTASASPGRYEDFDLMIGEGVGMDYPVAVLRSPAGEARETMHFPYDALRLENALDKLQIALLRSGGKRRKVLTDEQRDVQSFGQALFDALLTGEVRSRYDVSLERVRQAEKGLRVRLRFQSAEMAALPWEFLCDPRKDFMCLSSNTPLVRYLDLPDPPQPLTVEPPLRVLGVIANPAMPGREPLDVENEKQRIKTALRGMAQVELHWLEEPTWRGLQRAMRRETWHIIHFIGHGAFDVVADEGVIWLEGEGGEGVPLTATQLGRLLSNHPPLRLAVLNACEGAKGGTRDIFSSTASILVRMGLPAVLAMQYEITDRAAIELSRAFYEALADGLPVDAAVAEARLAVSLAVPNTVEWGTPVLYMRAPEGLLFKVRAAQRPQRVEPEQWATERSLAPEVAAVPPQARATEPAAGKPVARPAPAERPDTLTITEPIRMELVRVSAGSFLMGDEKNAVEVAEFYIGKHPVTNVQYAAFAKATKRGAPPAGKDDHPVVNVSWRDAVAFAEWLSRETGQPFRLPTEAEWEKAARWTDGRIYPWGNDWDPKKANTREGGPGRTTPVGQYSPDGDSPDGCADMAGNVWEWTSSLYKSYPYRPDDGREDPNAQGPRVLRGGSFYYKEGDARCASRYDSPPYYRYDDVGFRVGASPGL